MKYLDGQETTNDVLFNFTTRNWSKFDWNQRLDFKQNVNIFFKRFNDFLILRN